MKSKELINTSAVVEEILKKDMRSRKDDEYLVFKIVEYLHPEFAEKSFKEVLFNAKEINLNLDSIRRARQKLQAKNKDLRDYDFYEYRQERKKEFVDFVND